ncbi:type VII toxin-antitoxin system MntA family adenylyltransferase antitoxin [Guptibacillus sedimenti]|uniref:type VII toxin-antitoxin system MntA family adenylyltransferase antitoxin n=1 Tax=Guptibacillus sedimenti TaxID=3025680 RepID=UPI003B59A6A9
MNLLENKMLTEVVNILNTAVSPQLIYLFGSTAKGTSHAKSDLDIAFLSSVTLDEYEVFMLAQQIASKINQDVDLVDLRKASTVFQGQIVATGKTIYSTDEQTRMNYEMKVLKMYAKLGEERKLIIDDIEESGTVFNEE